MKYILILGTFESISLLLLFLGGKNKLLPDYLLGVIVILYAISKRSVYLELQNIKNDPAYSAILNMPYEELQLREKLIRDFNLRDLTPLLLIRFGYSDRMQYSFMRNLTNMLDQ